MVGSGRRRRPKGKPAGADDVFSMASATKPMVAALMLRLAELGKVDLDAPLASFGLDAGVTNGATIRQALEMRGGLGETDAIGHRPGARGLRPRVDA